MSKISELQKNLSEKQLKVIESDFDVEVVKELYGVQDDETAEMIIKALKEENRAVKDYIYTKKQIEAVERELYLNATLDDPEGKSTVKQKAIDSFLDRVKGKPQQAVDLTSKGKAIATTINIIKPDDKDNRVQTV